MKKTRLANILIVLLICTTATLFGCLVRTDQKVLNLRKEFQQELNDARADMKTVYVFGEVAESERVPTSEVRIGYDFNYVCRVITAEAGTNRDLCMAVAQCLFNACVKKGWEYPPTQILEQYGYTGPANWISEEAEESCRAVFVEGERYYPVRNALYFYAPRYVNSPWHESLQFVTEIGGVRFFEG